MRVIGVVDLAGGRAVQARGGVRADYVPVQTCAGAAIDGDPLALALAYVNRFGLPELYAADLDAICAATPGDASAGSHAARQAHDTSVRGLAAVAPLWLDAGVSSAEDACRVLSFGVARVVVGLETLGSFEALQAICAAVGGERVAFSLDLRHGDPVAPCLAVPPDEPAHRLAARAADAGAGAVIVIDLARVGTAAGLDLDVIARVRSAAPRPLLIAGGGVGSLADLIRLADAGCDGALVASALHDGRIDADDIRRFLHSSDRL